MIVFLHGVPNSGGKPFLHEIDQFIDIIYLRVAAWSRIGIEKSHDININAPIEHSIAFKFSYHDGTNYHYKFTGDID
jgi:hypothetical protein